MFRFPAFHPSLSLQHLTSFIQKLLPTKRLSNVFSELEPESLRALLILFQHIRAGVAKKITCTILIFMNDALKGAEHFSNFGIQ